MGDKTEREVALVRVRARIVQLEPDSARKVGNAYVVEWKVRALRDGFVVRELER